MRPTLKIVLGAAMIVAGIYWYSMDLVLGGGTVQTNLDALLVLLQGSVGLVVFLLGVFIVWIESDEMRIQRELEQQDFQPQPYSASGGAGSGTAPEEVELEAPDYDDIVSGTIDEVKETVEGRDLDLEDLLTAEKANKDRKTLKAWIEERMD